MDFNNYKKAAEKHLRSCLAIIDSIERLKRTDPQSAIVQRANQDTLHNLFYLSGYVLEAVSTYAVYKHYRWPSSKSVKEHDPVFSARCSFSFYPSHGQPYYVHGHKFQTNQFEVLKIPFHSSGIPFIDHSVAVDVDLLVLFNNWLPEIRYHASVQQYPYLLNQTFQLTEHNVYRFLQIARTTFNNLLQIVG